MFIKKKKKNKNINLFCSVFVLKEAANILYLKTRFLKLQSSVLGIQ